MGKRKSTLVDTVLFSLFFLLGVSSLQGQGSMNMTLLDTWNGNTFLHSGVYYNDIWGYVDDSNNEYAIVGSPQKVHFIDVTNPTNISLKAEFTLGATSLWRDFKVYDRFVYAVADEGTEGLTIFDMSALPAGNITQVYQSNNDFLKAHNIYIDVPNGRLYVVGAATNMIIYDLTADPANPTLLASTSVEGGYIHDIFVQDNIAYASSGFDGLYIFDVSNPNNIVLQANLDTGGYNHSSWIYENGEKIIYAEEVPNGRPLGVIDITNATNNDLSIVNTFSFPLEVLSGGMTYHNPYILGDYAVVSSYYDGVTIIDIADPNNASRVAYYDTYVNTSYAGLDGCWGVYPYLPSGNIIASDTQNGLFVLSTSINLPTGRCSNGVQDAFEQGVDCGGFCAPCTVAPTCSDGILNQDETGIDCGGANCPPCASEDCSIYDFTGQVVSYSTQDSGTSDVQDNGATVYLTNNAWKAVPLNYGVTQNTVLEFDFKSTVEGEIHEFGFDNDLDFPPTHRGVLYGNQGYNGTFTTPNYSGSGDFEHFVIEIGANFTGTFQYLVLTCDDDANAIGNSYFRNIQIYEDYNNNLMCDASTTCETNDNIVGSIPAGTYQASNTITSTGVVGVSSNVVFGASTICLDNGFEVELGAEFMGEINPCTNFESAPIK